MTDSKQIYLRPAVAILAAAGFLALPIFYLGMPGGNDLPQHYRFVHTFFEAAQHGDLYPAWPDTTNLGFGDVGIRFYPPLAYYVVIFFHWLTPDWATAFATSICFWFFVGGLGVYLFARECFSEKASIVAAIIFMAMPYHVNQVYNAGLFGEFAGLAVLPFCLLFTHRVISHGSIGHMIGLAISYALLILTHLPMLLMGSIILAVYGSLMLSRQRIRLAIPRLAAAIVAALAASSFYWVRMINELDLVQHMLPQFVDRRYDFHENFLAAILYVPADRYSETSAWFTDLLFAITLAMIVPAFVAFVLISKSESRRRIIPVVGAISIAVFLATPLSLPLWENIGSLQKIQFPWRLLGPISIFGAILIASFFDNIGPVFRSKFRPAGLIAVGLVIAGIVFTGSQVIRPATQPGRAEFNREFDRYQSDESYQCWWPIGAERSALAKRDRLSLDSRRIEITNWQSDSREFFVEPGPEGRVRIATFYYPHWKASVNGTPAETRRLDDGTIGIDVPSERADVRVYFERPHYETTSFYVSATTWILLLLGLLGGLVWKPTHWKLA